MAKSPRSRNLAQLLRQPARGPSRFSFKRSEAKRLLQSAVDVGLNVRGLEVDPNTGALRVLVDPPAAANAPAGQLRPAKRPPSSAAKQLVNK
jgi:hypothetical protein